MPGEPDSGAALDQRRRSCQSQERTEDEQVKNPEAIAGIEHDSIPEDREEYPEYISDSHGSLLLF